MLELGSIISEGEFDTGQYSTRRALYANYMWFGNIPGQQDLGKILKKRWRDKSINMKWNQAMGRVEDVDKNISKIPERVMMKLYEKTGDRTIIPSIVKDVKRVTERGVPFNLYLNQTRVNRLQKIKGDYVRHAVREAMRTPRFKNASDAEKIKILKDARKGWGTNEVMKRFSKYNSLVEFYEDQHVKLAPVKD